MAIRLQKASFLIDQGRYELAEPELTALMAEEPNNALAHSFMAICLLSRKQYAEATEYAERGIHLQPDLAAAYSIAALVWQGRNHLEKAESMIWEAITLAPREADYRANLSSIKYQQNDWEAARQAAEDALALDPENINAHNLRAESMRKLGRLQDAREELHHALRLNPDSADTHATLGWTYLQKGDRAKANEHFREALRLDPDSEWARQGILETLRTYNPLYRPLLKFFLWMQTLTGRAQWGVIIGLYVVYRIILEAARANPEWGPYLMPLIFVYVAFAAATWIGKPLMNLALRLHPLGRLALTREERIAANWIGGFLAGGGLALIASLFVSAIFLLVGLALLLMVIPLAAMFRIHEPRPRIAMTMYTVLLGICGVLFVVGYALASGVVENKSSPSHWETIGNLGLYGMLLGAFFSPLASNVFASIKWKR